MELVPRLNADEIRGLFAPPPWGIYLTHLLYVLFMAFSWLPCFLFDKAILHLDKQELNSSTPSKISY